MVSSSNGPLQFVTGSLGQLGQQSQQRQQHRDDAILRDVPVEDREQLQRTAKVIVRAENAIARIDRVLARGRKERALAAVARADKTIRAINLRLEARAKAAYAGHA